MRKDPKKDVNACQEFLLTILKGHLLAAAWTHLGVQKLDSQLQLPPGICKKSSAEQRLFLETIAIYVVNKCTVIDSAFTGGEVAESGDGVHSYARMLCHCGALVMEFLMLDMTGMGSMYIAVGGCSFLTFS